MTPSNWKPPTATSASRPGGRLRHRSLFESDFNAPDAPTVIRVPDRLDTVDRLFYQRGWTDGLPIIPPTPERYRALLGDLDPDELLGLVEPRLGRATVGKAVANAVMAGCRPEHVPVVVAATRAMCDPRFNLKALQSTTHPCTVMCLVGGPICDEIDLNASYNAMGQGQRANAVIGRAIRLILTNIGGAAPGVLDRSTMGSPAKYSFCFAENSEANPWETFHAELGLDEDASHVTVFGAEGPHNVNDHHGRTGEDILLTIAGTLASPGANNFYLGGQAVVVLGPEHAEVIARDGFSKADVKRYLSERAIIPRNPAVRSVHRPARGAAAGPPARSARTRRRAPHQRSRQPDRACGGGRGPTLGDHADVRTFLPSGDRTHPRLEPVERSIRRLRFLPVAAQHPTEECLDLFSKGGQCLGQSLFQRSQPACIQGRSVDIAKDMPEAKVFSQCSGECGIDDCGADSGNIEPHVLDELLVPLLGLWNTSVEFMGNPDQYAFDARIEVVHDRATRT